MLNKHEDFIKDDVVYVVWICGEENSPQTRLTKTIVESLFWKYPSAMTHYICYLKEDQSFWIEAVVDEADFIFCMIPEAVSYAEKHFPDIPKLIRMGNMNKQKIIIDLLFATKVSSAR